MVDLKNKNLDHIKAVLVVEDDESIQHFIAEPFTELGIDDIQCFDSGDLSWEAAQSKEYDFIVLDWKMRGVSGLGMLNRFRSHPYYRLVPILVVSGYLGRKDFSLLDEYPYTGRLIKPFENSDVVTEMQKLAAESLWYKKQEKAIINLFQKMGANPAKFCEGVKELVKTAPNPFPLVFSASRHLRVQGALSEAEGLISIALKLAPDSLMCMNEFGKILLMTKRYKEAEQVLLRAQELSPANLERLCDLGEVSLNQLNPERAKEFYEKALQIDEDSQKAKVGKQFSASIAGHFNSAKKVELTENFASLLNSIGISMVRAGQYQTGYEHYHNALLYVHEPDVRAKLAFNLGLGYLRQHLDVEALAWFKKSVEWGVIFKKGVDQVKSLEKKLASSSTPETSIEDYEAGIGDFEEDTTGPDLAGIVSATTLPPPTPELSKWGAADAIGKARWESAKLIEVRQNCPEIDEVVRQLVAAGFHLEIQMQRIVKLYDEYGQQQFCDAVAEGLRNKQFTAADLSHILLTHAPKIA